jgi:hypothetical protein
VADNVAITAGTGTTIAADELVDGTLGTVKVQYVKLMDGTLNSATKATVATTAQAMSAGYMLVALATDSVNANVNAIAGVGSTQFGAPIVGFDPYAQYKTVAASQTATVLGTTGAQYDYLAGVLVVPATTAPGNVLIRDGNGSDITVFVGGASSVGDLRPFMVPLGLYALAATTGGWRVTTGANVSVIGIGKFT